MMFYACSAVSDVYRQPVQTLKPLLLGALKYGESHGTMEGEVGRMMKKRSGSSEPILVDVKVVGNHPQPGCKNLSVAMSQDGVADSVINNKNSKDSKTKRPFSTDYTIYFCEYGGPPLPDQETTQSEAKKP